VGQKGVYKILVNNKGDSGAVLNLKVSDAQESLRYYLHPEFLTVPGAGRSEATLEVRLSWLAFLGGEKEFDFEVLATSPEGRFAEDTKIITGQLVRRTWYRTFPSVRLPRIRLRWLEKPPAISAFRATTDDKREFKLGWMVKRAAEIRLDDEAVEEEEERIVRPAEPTSYMLTATNKYGSVTRTVEVKPLPIPKAKASDRIRASLSQSYFQSSAGGAPVQATLQLQNLLGVHPFKLQYSCRTSEILLISF
jgi:hypothetical protein